MGLERDEGKYVDAERRAARDIDTHFFAVFAFFANCQCCLSGYWVMF